MTGFGGSITRRDGYIITSEIKTVNNRYLKTAFRISDGFSSWEPRIESLLRGRIERGSVNLSLKIRHETGFSRYAIYADALRGYLKAIRDFDEETSKLIAAQEIPSGSLPDYLRLPGVIADFGGEEREPESLWMATEANLHEALDALDAMRLAEGGAMAESLRGWSEELRTLVSAVERLAPGVADQYRTRLTERIGKILAEHLVELQPGDLVREVALFADRTDITEETVRFRSHLAQFEEAMRATNGSGKRLDFLTQELFREVNTIGSKGNDSNITRSVVEMKTVLERIREMVQNIE